MSLFRIEKMLNVRFPTFLLSAFLLLSIGKNRPCDNNLWLSPNNLGLLRKKAGLFLLIFSEKLLQNCLLVSDIFCIFVGK